MHVTILGAAHAEAQQHDLLAESERERRVSEAMATPSDVAVASWSARGAASMATRPQFGFALEYVSDIDAAKRFYVDVFGLEVEREHPTFVQFRDAAGA